MLVSEQELQLFQLCPWCAGQVSKGNNSKKLRLSITGYGISDPVQTITRWIWAQNLRTGQPTTLRATKHKWGEIVSQWGNACHWSSVQTRDHLTRYLKLICDYHSFYLSSGCSVLSVGSQIRIKIGNCLLVTLPQIVVASGNMPLLLNTSCDDNDFETTNNIIYQARAYAVAEAIGKPLTMVNHRFRERLITRSFPYQKICDDKFKNNLKLILGLLDGGYSIPNPLCKNNHRKIL